MTGYDAGDVVLVPYPFGERAGGRKRPALVLSPAAYNNASGELVVAQITSRRISSNRPGDYGIQAWKEANLPAPATVRARLATVPLPLVLRRLGGLTEADFQGARRALTEAVWG